MIPYAKQGKPPILIESGRQELDGRGPDGDGERRHTSGDGYHR